MIRCARTLFAAVRLRPVTGRLSAAIFVLLSVIVLSMLSRAAPADSGVGSPPRIDINTADAATLAENLPGVGPVKAQAIIDHRDRQGTFAAVDQLLEVKGIGPVTLEKLRPLIDGAGFRAGRQPGSNPGSTAHEPGSRALPIQAMEAAAPESPTVAQVPLRSDGYFSIDSGGTATSVVAGDAQERATVRAVREVIRRVREQGLPTP